MWDVVMEYWQQLIAAFTVVLWALRLESKVKANTKEVESLEKKIVQGEENRKLQRTEDMTLIRSSLDSIQTDIKQILLRQHDDHYQK